jgi:hypothetical protein
MEVQQDATRVKPMFDSDQLRDELQAAKATYRIDGGGKLHTCRVASASQL